MLALDTGSALAARKLAFVVGIDRYDNLGSTRQLKKAVNDARAVSAALRGLGYETTLSENAGRLELIRQWQQFLNRIEPGDVAALYFSGHGVEISGANYLLPGDVPMIEDGELQVLVAASLSLNGMLDQMQARHPRISLNIIDACRDNPFQDSLGRTIGASRDLARINPATGTFVMYSAGAGQVALDALTTDDADPNSVYTRNLLKYMRKPGLTVTDVARNVRLAVADMTKDVGHEQIPAYYDELVGRFCLAGCDASPRSAGEAERIAADYKAAAGVGTRDAWELFLAEHGASADNFLVKLARKEFEKLATAESSTPSKPDASVCGGGELAKVAGQTRCVKPSESFRDCRDCPEVVVVPRGSFMMGSPNSEKDRQDNESPQHKVTIAYDLAVGKYEVTRGEFAAFVAATGYDTGIGNCQILVGDRWKLLAGMSWRKVSFEQTDRHPVICVSVHDAKAYAKWLADKTGENYRLLSEAEWEFAARAGTTTSRFWGNDDSGAQVCIYANAADKTNKAVLKTNWDVANCTDGYAFTAPVGSFKPNGFQLYDMLGNVNEWVADCRTETYDGAPTDGSASTFGDCSHAIPRGGSWIMGPRYLRSALRGNFTTTLRIDDVGFRIARTLRP